jgi:hypothetical protein
MDLGPETSGRMVSFVDSLVLDLGRPFPYEPDQSVHIDQSARRERENRGNLQCQRSLSHALNLLTVYMLCKVRCSTCSRISCMFLGDFDFGYRKRRVRGENTYAGLFEWL